MTNIKVKEIMPGMILNQDIYMPDTDIIALESGTVLTDANVRRVKELKIDSINILVQSKIKHNKKQKVEFNNHYVKLKNKLRILFESFKNGRSISLNQIDDEIDNVLNNIIKYENISPEFIDLDFKEDYLINHSLQVSLLSVRIGKILGYSKNRLKELLISGIFHDIGMLRIPEEIRLKPGPLSEEEFIVVMNHTINGYRMLKDIPGLSSDVAYGALEHHEREDGSGYPLGIKSNEIHEFGKIIAIADVFDAMTTDKVYREKKLPFIAVEEILYDSFGVLDGELTELFLKNISQFYIGNTVRLNDGSEAKIVHVNKAIPTKPVISKEGRIIDLLKNDKYKIIDIID